MFLYTKGEHTMTNTKKHNAVKDTFLACGLTLLLGSIVSSVCLVLDKILIV